MSFPSLEVYDKLQKQRPDINNWMQNIIEAELHIQTEKERKHFMHYILNPKLYDPKLVEHTVTHGELYDKGELKDERETLAAHMQEHRYQNGKDTIVHVENTQLPLKNLSLEDDEKCPVE